MDRAEELVRINAEKTAQFFGPSAADEELPPREDEAALTRRLSTLYNDLYRGPHERQKAWKARIATTPAPTPGSPPKRARTVLPAESASASAHNTALTTGVLAEVENVPTPNGKSSTQALTVTNEAAKRAKTATALALRTGTKRSATSVAEALAADRPTWHAPWKMYRAISGHLGWVRCVAVDSSNEWFATGSADRTIKVWSLASGRLRLTLTGHVAAVRALAVSSRHPYLFSAGEDKSVKCWDLEQNKVVRSYYGHLSGVYSCALHPTLDVLFTGGRDSAIRVWDMRTRTQVHALTGHRDSINDIIAQRYDPQVVSASVDSTIRMWDLAAGRCASVLTNHKRGVRALAAHPGEFSFASASVDAVKTWAFPHGVFMRNLRSEKEKELVNCMAVNQDGVLVAGGNDGTLAFWDYPSAHCFQKMKTTVQPGSLDCEAGILDAVYDMSGSRIITCEMDKTIKMWKEDTEATPETHPLNWQPNLAPRYY